MALNAMQKDTVSKACQLAKKILDDIKPVIDRLRVIYDTPTTGLKATIIQQDLDDIASFSGLTKQQLEDGMYVLTGLVSDNLNTGQTALEQLAARGN